MSNDNNNPYEDDPFGEYSPEELTRFQRENPSGYAEYTGQKKEWEDNSRAVEGNKFANREEFYRNVRALMDFSKSQGGTGGATHQVYPAKTNARTNKVHIPKRQLEKGTSLMVPSRSDLFARPGLDIYAADHSLTDAQAFVEQYIGRNGELLNGEFINGRGKRLSAKEMFEESGEVAGTNARDIIAALARDGALAGVPPQDIVQMLGGGVLSPNAVRAIVNEHHPDVIASRKSSEEKRTADEEQKRVSITARANAALTPPPPKPYVPDTTTNFAPDSEGHGELFPAAPTTAEVIAPAPSVPVAMTAQAEKSRRKTQRTYQTNKENKKTQAQFAKKFEREAQTEAARIMREMIAAMDSDAASAETERKAFLATPEGISLASAEAKRERKRLRNGVSEPAAPTASAPAVDMDSMDRSQERLDAIVNAEAPDGGGGNPPSEPPGGGGPPNGPPEGKRDGWPKDPRFVALLAKRELNKAESAWKREQLRTKTQSRSAVDGRAELHAAQKAAHRLGAVSTEDYVEFLNKKVHDEFLLPRERMGAQAELAGIEAARQKAEAKQNAGTPNTEQFGPSAPADELHRRREELAREQYNRHAADPKLRPHMGGQKYQDELRKTFKREKVDNAADSPGGKLGLGGAIAGYRFVRALEQAIGTGGLVSSAVGSLVKGLTTGVVAASGGLIAVGETLLGFVLTPFGKSGQAIGNAAQSLGKALISGLQAGGALASGVVQLTYGLKAIIWAAAGTAIVGGLGALVGAFAGGGGLAGAVAGAGIGAMIAGTLLQGMGQVVSQISGVVGSALSAIGTALGEVGKSASELLKSIATLLSDIIATGTKFSQAAIGNSLMGGMSPSAGLTSASLAQVLTGSANGLSSFYGSMSNMSPFLASKQAAFGIKGVNASDPTSMLMPGYNRFQELGHGPDGAIQQRIMMQSVYGGAASSMMQLFTAGPDSIRELIRVVKENQLTPKESANNEKLQFDISGIEMKADKIKMKMLSMFMPLIESVFPALEKGMTTFGDFMKNKFLIYLRLGSDYMFAFGQTLAESLPKVFIFIEKMLMGLIVMAKNLAGMLAPLVSTKSPILGKALTEFSNAPLSKFGLGIPKEGTAQKGKDAEATHRDIDDYNARLEQLADKTSSYATMPDTLRRGLQMKYRTLLKASQDKLAHGVNAETDDEDIDNADQLPFNKTVNDWSKKLGSKLTSGQAEVNNHLDPIIGTNPEQKALLDAADTLRAQALEVQKAMDDPLRQKTDDDTGKLKQMAEERDALNAAAKVKSDQAYNSMLKNSGGSRDNTYRTTSGGNPDNHTVLDVNINYDKDGLINVKHEFSKQSAQQLVRAMQHSN